MSASDEPSVSKAIMNEDDAKDKIELNSKSNKFQTTQRLRFDQINLTQWLIDQCKAMGINEPTSVQFNCIPEVLKGNDVIGCSRTGTGKTLAFVLPILQLLSDDPFGIFALVLTPTRELAFQIADQFKIIGKTINLNDCVVVGGRDMVKQAVEIERKPHILIATPGRLMDHFKSGTRIPLKHIKFLVMDEADRLLDGQYEDQLAEIFPRLPKKKQTLLFSATITDALNRLRDLSIKKPFFFEDKGDDDVMTVSHLTQKYILCPVTVKDAFLVYAVMEYHHDNPNSSILIFSQSCRECQALAYMFRDLGFKKSGALHALVPQAERMATLSKFRSDRLKILICTDVASRGLDILNVNLVVNHNVPASPKSYVHRVGRAARAGRKGEAITCVTQHDIKRIKAIEKMIGMKLSCLKISDRKVAECVTEVLVAKREAEVKLHTQNFGEKKEVYQRKQLILDGVSEDEVDERIEEMKARRVANSKQRISDLKKESSDHLSKPQPKGLDKRKANRTFAERFDLKKLKSV